MSGKDQNELSVRCKSESLLTKKTESGRGFYDEVKVTETLFIGTIKNPNII